jgi:hypothetical protein
MLTVVVIVVVVVVVVVRIINVAMLCWICMACFRGTYTFATNHTDSLSGMPKSQLCWTPTKLNNRYRWHLAL